MMEEYPDGSSCGIGLGIRLMRMPARVKKGKKVINSVIMVAMVWFFYCKFAKLIH